MMWGTMLTDNSRRGRRMNNLAFSRDFPRRSKFANGAKLVLILCLFHLCSAVDYESRNTTERLVKNASDSQKLNDSDIAQRIFNNHQIVRRHLRTRDTRRLLPNDMKLAKHGNLPLLLKRQQTSTNPWSTLYHHQYQPTPAYTRSSSAPTIVAPVYQVYSPIRVPSVHHRMPAGHMLTVFKTDGPPSVQRTNFKDYYKSINNSLDDSKRSHDADAPESSRPSKINSDEDQELEDIHLAYDHLQRMRVSGRCHHPTPEVVCVKNLYPSATKEYVPRCTLLHRCGDKSGCCDKAELRCAPKAIQEVALNFYTVIHPRPAEANVAGSIEKLLFENHTECECINAANEQSTTYAHTIATTSTIPTTTSRPSTTTTTTSTTTTTAATTTSSTTTSTTPPPPDEELQKDRRSTEMSFQYYPTYCGKCPPPFYVRENPGGWCTCDCFDKQKPCLKIKRGRLPLEEHWRRCVEQRDCHSPKCEYGTYDEATGRCPERPDGYPKNRKNIHFNHRMFEERD